MLVKCPWLAPLQTGSYLESMGSTRELPPSGNDAWRRLNALCQERYSPDLYELDPLAGAGQRMFGDDAIDHLIKVALSAEGHEPVRYRDAPHHAILDRRVHDAFGQRPRFVEAGDGELSIVRHYRANAAGQNKLFEEFAAGLPVTLRAHFPITSVEAQRTIELLSLEIAWPSAESLKVSSRCIVYARVVLVEDARPVREEEVSLFNFYAPLKRTGRAFEPGNKWGRPFDEVRFQFEQAVTREMKQVGARLAADALPHSLTELLLGPD